MKATNAPKIEPSTDAIALIEEKYLTVKNRQLCVRLCGNPNDPALVFLHGIQSHAGVWERLAVMLAQAGYFVVMPDRRGHGKSDHYDAYHLFDYVADLDEVIAQIVTAPFTLIGHCESCMITALYAGISADSLNAALFIQFPVPPRQAMDDATKFDLLRSFINKSRQPHNHAIMSSPEEAAQRSMQGAPFPMPEEIALHVANRNIKQFGAGYCWRWDPQILNYRLLYNTIDLKMVSTALSKLKVPVTFLYGQDSSLMKTDKDRHLKITQALRPDSRQIMVPGGHYPHMEDSRAVLASIIIDALK